MFPYEVELTKAHQQAIFNATVQESQYRSIRRPSFKLQDVLNAASRIFSIFL